ncbi:MAG TPA: flagellar motor protein [Armatimonadota bacterium]
MDLATILGLLLGWGAFLGSILMEGGSIGGLINIPAFILVVGGTLGATVISYPLSAMTSLPLILKNAFIGASYDTTKLVMTVVDLAKKARREGILVLEDEARKIDNVFLRTGIQLVVDGVPSEAVREILETEVVAMQERHKVGESIMSAMGGFGPTLGVIGTVSGLVHMLHNLSDPGKMGPAIAGAFIATLYGVCTANLIYLPIAGKLKCRSAEEVAYCVLVIEGILSIQAGDNPRIVESKMRAFLGPKQREALERALPEEA